ncbi:uncharacterized protein LOC119640570 isoform X2 [Glossina fuscipes]|uniref:Uncharacterized protein LOC119640570 isoform X2 n=2 Tax=Glossina fuscipes TaxID=7396 RepID=A0A9C5Z9L3_9MUSC|nr:uncharacterized protein LOC119640570 isoform X2 [Glossina fuscipes]
MNKWHNHARSAQYLFDRKMENRKKECTLDKMKSIDTWLFELNKFAYFDTGANKSPLMNCQKVVARDPNTNKMVTARFCQLNTGDSDACAILQAKLRSSSEDKTQTMQNTNGNNYNNNGRRGAKQATADVEEQFHCSICTTDSCNGVTSFKVNRLWGVASISLFTLLNKINWQKSLSEFC